MNWRLRGELCKHNILQYVCLHYSLFVFCMPMETYTNSNTSVFRYCFRIRLIVSILQTSKYIRVTTANNNSNIRVSSLCVASVLKHDIAQKSRPVTFYSKLRELCQRGGILLTSNANLFLGANRFPYIRQWHLDIVVDIIEKAVVSFC